MDTKSVHVDEQQAETKQEQDLQMENADGTVAATVEEPQANDSPATSATAVNEAVAEEEQLSIAMEDDQGETVVEAEEDTVIY
jgi:hypothetical protein